jgi:aminotransferase
MIRQMTRISLNCGAINLSQGFPDFDPPKEITDRLKTVADEGPHQYAVNVDVHHLIRLHFAKKDETLNKDLNRLEKINTLIK